MAPLTDEQRAELRVHATAAALSYHDQTVPATARVDPAASFFVQRDLRLVAADILETAALYAAQASEGTSATKKIKVGKIEIEKAAQVASGTVDAGVWTARAARLRQDVTQGQRRGLPLAGIRIGLSGPPSFTRSEPLERPNAEHG